MDFIPLTQTSLAFSPPVLYAATICLDTSNLLISLPWEEETTREEEVMKLFFGVLTKIP